MRHEELVLTSSKPHAAVYPDTRSLILFEAMSLSLSLTLAGRRRL
jgi:hypothetical protein